MQGSQTDQRFAQLELDYTSRFARVIHIVWTPELKISYLASKEFVTLVTVASSVSNSLSKSVLVLLLLLLQLVCHTSNKAACTSFAWSNFRSTNSSKRLLSTWTVFFVRRTLSLLNRDDQTSWHERATPPAWRISAFVPGILLSFLHHGFVTGSTMYSISNPFLRQFSRNGDDDKSAILSPVM